MSSLSFLERRRSIRNFEDREIEEEILSKIIYAGRIAPSSKNRQPWKFYVVKNKKLLRELSKIHFWAKPIEKAPLAIVVAVDENLSPNHFVEDGSCAAMNMWIAASNLGLGAVWIAVYSQKGDEREKKVREILKIPENYRIICILPMGYAAESPKEKKIKSESEVVEVVE